MKESIILGLIQNTSILLVFSMLYDFLGSRNEQSKSLLIKIATGVMLGGIGVVLILTPWTLIPGIFFDTRSVMLSVAGLFFGPVPTVTAMIITGSFRLYMGGDGVLMGIAVVLFSGSIGLLWRYFRSGWKKKNPLIELTVMGFLVHLVMLCCIFFLPENVRWQTLKNIVLPVILIYPLATVLLGLLMLKQVKNRENRKALNISEERWHFALEGAGDGVWDWNPVTNEVFYSKQYKHMLGYENHEIENNLEEWDKRIFPDDREIVYELLNKYMRNETPAYVSEHRLKCKDGTYKWILDRGKIMSRDSEGKPMRIIGTHTDITIQKQTQEKIKKLNEELEQKVLERTNQLSAKNADLEKMNNFFVGRELRMIELKEQISTLQEKLEKSAKQ
jgi:PAS domain S-box-containing protein